MKPGWLVVLAGVVAFLIGVAACEVDVPLGVDPNSDAAHVDAGDAGG
jgi:hypothetical protein